MFCHTWVFVLLLILIVVLILIVICFVFVALVFWKFRAEVAVLAMTLIIALTFPMVSMPPSTSMLSEHKSSRILASAWRTDIHIDDIAEIAEYVVEEVEMLTKFYEKVYFMT